MASVTLVGPKKTVARSIDDKTKRRPLLVIDGDSFAHRSYHALPKTILRNGGRPAGAILGFANRLLQLHRAEQPRAVLVGWDTLEAPTYRHKDFPAYQGGREFDDALIEQLELIRQFVAACGFANAKRAGYEADDFLAAAAAKEERRGGTVLIASGDRDAFQLASGKTTILYPVRAGEMARIGPDEVRARYGIEPKQVPDFIALRGDPSDGLPGAPGIGPKTAAMLLAKHGSLEGAIAGADDERPKVASTLKESADALRAYRDIATLRTASVKRPPDRETDLAGGATAARELGLNRLAERLESAGSVADL